MTLVSRAQGNLQVKGPTKRVRALLPERHSLYGLVVGEVGNSSSDGCRLVRLLALLPKGKVRSQPVLPPQSQRFLMVDLPVHRAKVCLRRTQMDRRVMMMRWWIMKKILIGTQREKAIKVEKRTMN
jgi:hypothetical protein